ncbi:RHS repeat-associated core domain-containing protein [Fimbriiglobus ruber]|uniref:Wall-associated protein n=1 Tax=Fimbriiglobus ruber TaxID=1908690 RepID=A0A225DLF5_9BACT|nr:RHS repeat-associated core domain-containing protein [Fimbriiglobus ruber]OWK39388.1 Wall-associated protein precursor [Fimbriiglobus ruber]
MTYSYDGNGRRVGKAVAGDATQYVWDFEKVLQEADGSGATDTQYLSTDAQYGDLVSGYGGGQTQYYAFDAVGSADALLDDTGAVADAFAYRAYGLATQTAGTDPVAHTWVGRLGYQSDPETSLYFLRDRYYDPTTARFLTTDPVGYAGEDANLYRYTGSDPINHTGPIGHTLVATDTAPLGRLQQEIQSGFGVSPTEGSIRLGPKHPCTVLERVSWYNYYVVDLFDSYPPELWPAVQASQSPLGWLLYWSVTGEKGDFAISPNSDGSLRWKENVCTTLVGNLIGSAGQAINGLVAAAGGLLNIAGSAVLEGVKAALQVGLAAYGKALEVLTNGAITTQTLLDAIDQFGRYVGPIVTAGQTVLTNLFKWATQGLGQYLTNIGAHITDAVKKWLGPVGELLFGLLKG